MKDSFCARSVLVRQQGGSASISLLMLSGMVAHWMWMPTPSGRGIITSSRMICPVAKQLMADPGSVVPVGIKAYVLFNPAGE